MLIKKYVTSNTGNSVANHTEKHFICDSCNGSGQVTVKPEEIFEIMEHTTLEYALRVYKQWRTWDGKIDCGECSGEGSWVVRT